MLNITFQQFEVFLAVAERLNMTDTADALYVSQSALSRIIGRMEDTMGIKLFIRQSRGVSLTREGQFLYDAVRSPYKKIVSAVAKAQALQQEAQKTLRIGFPGAYDYNPDYDIVKDVLSSFKSKYPDADVIESIFESEALRDSLLFQETDIIIIQAFMLSGLDGIRTLELSDLNSYFVVSAKHRLAGEEQLPFDRMTGETVYTISAGNQADSVQRLNSLCQRLGFTPRAARCVPNIQTLIRNIADGRGVALCGKISSENAGYRLRYFPIPESGGGAGAHIVAAWLDSNPSRELKRLADMLKSEAGSRRRSADSVGP